ncbi:MAG: efflux RND transporter permease subunit [Flavobacteriales bacterium]|nr:efflux RND transporter permease subunit [Flavobacteriales bacterium]
MDPKTPKEFGLSTASIKNRTTVAVLIAIILISGISSYITVPKESFPEVVVPEVFVGTPYPGNSPGDIEKLITRPIEKELKGITGTDEIISTSQQGYSSIDIKFDFSVTPEVALRKVKDKVDIAMSDPSFPDDLPSDPNIFDLNFTELVPVMQVNLSGDYPIDQLEDYAEILQERIEDIEQINEAEIRGVNAKEMEVEVDHLRAEAMLVSFNDIAQAIGQENLSISGGDILMDGRRRTVQVVGDFRDAQDLEAIIVKAEGGTPVYLRDVANVRFVDQEATSFAREWGNPVVSLDVRKRAGENLIIASDEINRIIAEAKAEFLPSDLNVSITSDQSDQTRTQVDELQNSIILGVLLVVGVLLFFLGLRNALFVGVAIPLSMFLSFAILNALGITFNVMVLFALVLALGMLVDNGIVVVENIYRLMDEGMSPFDAARFGVGEVAWPIIASTATTLAAFLPLAIWPGIIGEFMKYLPMTLIIVLSSSLFIALVINPMLTSLYMRVEEAEMNVRRLFITTGILFVVGLLLLGAGWNTVGNLFILGGIIGLLNRYLLTPATAWFQNKLLPALENAYERLLHFSLRGAKPWLFFYGMIGLLFASLVLLGMFPPKVEFFPQNEPQYVNVYIDMPIGTDIEETNRVTQEVEGMVMKAINRPDFLREGADGASDQFLVNSVIAQVGEGTSDPAEGPQLGATPNKGRITVSFLKFQDRQGLRTTDVLNAIRDEVKGYPDALIRATKNSDGPPQGLPINLEITSANYETALAYADGMKRFIESTGIQGVEGLKLDVEKSKPEMPITIDRDKARRYGLSTQQIGYGIRSALFGREVSRYKDGEDDYPINLRFSDAYRNNADALMNQKIIFRSASDGQIKEVPISAVATAGRSTTYNAIKRKDLDRTVTLSSNVLGGYNANEVVAAIKDAMNDYPAQDGVQWEFTGQQEEQAKEMAFLSKALVIALFLIFLIIVAQFNSISTPFIIGFSVLFSLTGVFLGLVVFRQDFVIIMTMIGIISLAGVVVNNAIVLIDYTNLLFDRKKRELGLGEDDPLPFAEIVPLIIKGGRTRLRPVLLTAITTVLGLLPLAIGINVDFVSLLAEYDPKIYIGGDNNIFWKPMSWAIIYGLTFATFLTLVIVPIMMWYLTRAEYKWLKRLPVNPS